MAEKKVKSVKKPQCNEKGCRKSCVDGESYCMQHRKVVADDGVPPGTCRLSELDLLKFVRTDNELHNHSLEIKNLEQEQMIEEKEFDARRAARVNRIRLLNQSIRQRQVDQKTLMAELGKKYGFDYTIASVDDQTGVVHEHPTKGK